MFSECCRIFVLERKKIENIISECKNDNIFLETCFYSTGAYIKCSSDKAGEIRSFFNELDNKTGFFFLKNSRIDNYSLSAEDIAGNLLEQEGRTCVTAESCTGGLVAKKLTDRQGSSAYFWGSFVTYDNRAKNLLGVKESTIEKYGAVSAQTVSEMSENALEKSDADIAVSVSGVAGPGGGSAEKPVGTVWFGYCDLEKAGQFKVLFKGNRKEVREKASETALLVIIKSILQDAGVDSIICGDYI